MFAQFDSLLQADDRLLGTRPVMDLVAYTSRRNRALAVPVVRRMLASSSRSAAENGGQLAAWLGVRWDEQALLQEARQSTNNAARAGAARSCAINLPFATDVDAATDALVALMNDPAKEVQDGAAELASALRGHSLRPHRDLIHALAEAPAFGSSLAQLLITLEGAPDRIDDLVLEVAEKFVAEFGETAGDIRTSRSADAHNLAELVFRAYAQAGDDPATRSRLLDLIDGLLLINAYGLTSLLDESER